MKRHGALGIASLLSLLLALFLALGPGTGPVAAQDAEPADGTAADGTAADGTAADGTAADGTAADGTAADGTAADGTAADDTVSTSQDFALLRVHRIDDASDPLRLFAMSHDYDVAPDSVSVTVDGAGATVDAVDRASASSHSGRMVIVVDASERMVAQSAIDQVVLGLKSALGDLSPDVEVAVIRAGIRPTVIADFGSANDAVLGLASIRQQPAAALNDAVRTASTMLTEAAAESPVDFSSVVLVAGGGDVGSTATAADATIALLNSGAQLVNVRYHAGDAELSSAVDRSGGSFFSADTAVDLPAAVGSAMKLAGERLVVDVSGAEPQGLRPSLEITVGDQSEFLSYRVGQNLWRATLLEPVSVPDGGGFFATRVGFYIVLALAFLGISMGVYAAANLVGSGESSLDELIQRYSNDVGGEELSEAEHAVVQTALVQRATEAAESFAADRGFLVKVENMLEKANLPLRPGEAMSLAIVGIITGVAFGFMVGGPLAAALFGVLTALVFVGVVRFLAARRMKKFVAQLPDALQLLSGTLKAGYSLPQGLEAVSQEISDPMGYELRRVMTEARLGRELEEALGSAAERLESPDFAWAVMAIAIQREVGGNLAELLTTVAGTMIARERMRREVAALTAEGRMSAFILGGLPPALGFMMWVMRPEYIEVLFSETLGNIFLGAAAISMTIGGFWMKKVITINV